MFRTRFAAVVLSGGLMLVSGCMQLDPCGGGLFARRPFLSSPCCSTSDCGCGSSTMISRGPTVITQDVPLYSPMPGQTLPPPRITTTPNSPVVPYTP
jgi:hypothetical protein